MKLESARTFKKDWMKAARAWHNLANFTKSKKTKRKAMHERKEAVYMALLFRKRQFEIMAANQLTRQAQELKMGY